MTCNCAGLGYIAWIAHNGVFCWAQCVCRRMAKSAYREFISGSWKVLLRTGDAA